MRQTYFAPVSLMIFFTGKYEVGQLLNKQTRFPGTRNNITMEADFKIEYILKLII